MKAMFYAVYCEDADGVDEVREKHLAPHKEYLKSRANMLVVGGALLSENEDSPVGSLYIVNAPDRAAADAFLKNDPFAKAGVFGKVTITAMRKSHWNPGSAG